jgi:hypothetical protein
MKKIAIILFTFVAVICSCNSKNKLLTKDELTRYINNKKNGLMEEQEINGIKVRLSYRPSSMMVTQETEGVQKVDSIAIISLENKYKDNYYFLLNISKDNKEVIRQLGNFDRYSDMVQVFAFQMNQFVNLTTPQKDTIPLADYLFDQTYGMSNGNTILLAFNKNKIADKKNIEINIGECGLGIGDLKFRFEKENLDKIPKLDYNSSL